MPPEDEHSSTPQENAERARRRARLAGERAAELLHPDRSTEGAATAAARAAAAHVRANAAHADTERLHRYAARLHLEHARHERAAGHEELAREAEARADAEIQRA